MPTAARGEGMKSGHSAGSAALSRFGKLKAPSLSRGKVERAETSKTEKGNHR